MSFDPTGGRSILEATPTVLRALLAPLTPVESARPEGEGRWSVFDVVGHLVHGERADWIPRARIIFAHGETRPFDPFDRFAQRTASRGRTLLELLDDFDEARRASLRALDDLAMSPDDLARRGTHPTLGSVTLGELLATWVTHDLAHTAQIARILARQRADDVGPWNRSDYLGILSESRRGS